MGLKHVDIESAIRRVAEQRIEDAIAEGKFENLPGAGKPLELEAMPPEENARMTWWIVRLLRQNGFTQQDWPKQIDHLREQIHQPSEESGPAGAPRRRRGRPGWL